MKTAPLEPMKEKILRFLRVRVGRVVQSEELSRSFGEPAKWKPALEALRKKDGYRIATRRERRELGSEAYVLESLQRRPILDRSLSPAWRPLASAAADLVCRFCGYGPSDTDPYNLAQNVRLRVSPVIPESNGGPVVLENLHAVCENCWEGRRKATLPAPPSRRELLMLARRADPVDQIALLEWLEARYGRLARRMRGT